MELVRFTSAEQWPRHYDSKHGVGPSERQWPKWRGKELVIFDAVDPDDGWTCNTKKVYRVSDETLLRMKIKRSVWGNVFVCEHQIERDKP